MIKSPFRYPGAKTKIIPILMEYIDSMLVGESEFHDVFVGGGSVALSVAEKYPNIKIHLNDKDECIYSFWNVVSGSNNGLITDLCNLIDQPVTVDLFYHLREDVNKDLVFQAYKALFFNRTCFSGILKSGPIGGKDQKSKYKVDCRYNASSLKNKIKEINKLLSGRTEVFNQDINDYLINTHKSGVMYIDPPYFLQGKNLYTEYMQTNEHEKMAQNLSNKQKWLLSYDDCFQIRDYYKNNNIIDLAMRYSINGKKDSWANKNELIITL